MILVVLVASSDRNIGGHMAKTTKRKARTSSKTKKSRAKSKR